MKFSEKLQNLRKESKLSQEQFSDMLDVSRQAVSKWESGQTYPEMDKLISMTKIFKCSLDDLTNDEVINLTSGKGKTGVGTFLDDMLEIIAKSFKMITTMSPKAIAGCIISMGIVLIVIAFLHLPVEYIFSLGNNIFYSFGITAHSILSSIWRFILEIAYMVAGTMLFLYIYKVRYLDNFDETKYIEKKQEVVEEIKEEVEINTKDEKNKKNNVKIVRETINKSNPFSTIFKILGHIFMFFVKLYLIMIEIPFALTLLCLFLVLAISVGLIFKGIFFLGLLLILLSSIVLNLAVIEIIFNFIVSRKLAAKRIFITILSAIAILGIGSGITMLDISEFKYLEEVPKIFKSETKKEEFIMDDKLMIDYHYYGMNFIEDESLKNKIVVEVSYYSDYVDLIISKSNANCIDIYSSYKDISWTNKIVDLVITDVKKKQIRDYGMITNVDINIKGSSKNLKLLLERYDKYYENQQINSLNTQIEELNTTISKYEEKIYELDMKLSEAEYSESEKIENYKNELSECELKISEYKERINSIMND